MPKPYCVALTGGIGSGKSTISNKFSSLGVPIIDSDVISRDLVEPGQPALANIIEQFGDDYINSNGELNRSKLKQLIFTNEDARNNLENILHPLIYNEIQQRIKSINYPYCLIVIPLLIETEQTKIFDRILVVSSSEEHQIARVSKRDGLSRYQIKEILESQVDQNTRNQFADDIIKNDIEIDKLEPIIEELHTNYLKYASMQK